jgi:hypothetical protein
MKKYRSFAVSLLILITGALLMRSVASRTATGLADAQVVQDTPTLEQRITALERKELDAIKDGNINLFSDLLAEDAVFLNSRGFGDKALVVKNTSAFKLTEYSMENVKVVPLSANSGLIAYKLTEKGNAHGQEISGQVYASAVWAERGGKWVCLFSQETPAK